jgi:hypothetical protein
MALGQTGQQQGDANIGVAPLSRLHGRDFSNIGVAVSQRADFGEELEVNGFERI